MSDESTREHSHEWNPDSTFYEKAAEYEALLSLDQEEEFELRRACRCGINERATLSTWAPTIRDKRLTDAEREEIYNTCEQLDFMKNTHDGVEKFIRLRRCADEAA